MPDPAAAIASRPSDRSLTIVARRTYRIAPGQPAAVADEQLPLRRDVVLDPDRGHLREDLDLCVHKHRTDVVVQASAYAPDGRPAPSLEASVSVGQHRKRVLVLGDRCCRHAGGRTWFDDPEPFESMPVVYTRAYGGRDEALHQRIDERLRAMRPYLEHDISHMNLAVYLRNGVGMGYAIDDGDALDGVRLPNLEDPDERLTPETLAVRDPNRWYRQPMPAGFDWYGYDWFPRCVHLGVTWGAPQRDDLPRPGDPPIREVRLGLLPADVFDPKPIQALISDRVTNGASPGLAVPYLSGGEPVELVNLHPEHSVLSFSLPAGRPRLFMTPLGEERCELEPRLYSVIVQPEPGLLSLVWAGRTQTSLPYGREQIERIPFEVRW